MLFCVSSPGVVGIEGPQAVSVRRRTNPEFVADSVIHHSDDGARHVSLALTEKLLDHGITGSIGRVSAAHDDALMESTIG